MIRAFIAQLAYRWAAIIGAGIWEDDSEDERRPATRIPGQSPGYWPDGWVFTGCRRHDLDPCAECDSE